jgi:hypothetical protein
MKKTVQDELSELQQAIAGLGERIERLEREMLAGERALQQAIKARGMQIHGYNPEERLFFTAEASSTERAVIYNLLRHYSFRLFLRDAIKKKDAFWESDLIRYCSVEVARQYIAALRDLNLVEELGTGAYRLVQRSLFSFGPTLEWFVAQMFQREFASPAIYGVRFKETSSGGDYDVIARWEGKLVYVEIKSSPPRGIERSEIGSFFARITDLLPDIVFFFVDTHLRMLDKIVPMFAEAIEERYGQRQDDLFSIGRVADELFHINHRMYIVNAKKDAVDNVNRCLNDFLFYERATSLPLVPRRGGAEG